MKLLVIRSEQGKIVEEETIEGSMAEVVKRYAEKAFREWNPEKSDFTVLRGKYELRLKLPINPDLLDIIEGLNLDKRIEFGELVVEIPIVTISFDNEWINDEYYERKMYILSPYIDVEDVIAEIRGYAEEATREAKKLGDIAESQLNITEDELRRLEEGLKEIEEKSERKGKKSRRRKKKSNKS